MATSRELQVTAAALMRMQAHSLDSQAVVLSEMSRSLREQADRVEHGGELPNLRVAEESEEEKARELPRIRPMTESERDAVGAIGTRYVAEDGGELPDWAMAFLRTFHRTYTRRAEFAEVFNAVAAGRPPTVEVGVQVTSELGERRGG